MKGMVHLTGGGIYTIALDSGLVVEASLRGRLKLEERPGDKVVIGDLVRVLHTDDDDYVIEEIFPRETTITHSRSAGRSVKVLVANAERLLAVCAIKKPKLNPDLIDRLLVIAEHGGVKPVVVLNKIDLDRSDDTAEEIERIYDPLGYDFLKVSALTGQGMGELAKQVCQGITVLAGPSGVGKSSLVNALEPDHKLRTGELSRKRNLGRHTTVTSRLIQLQCGGLVADTPGFSDIGVCGVGRTDLSDCFPEFRSRSGDCRFRNCSHIHEPDCAVREAFEAGEISEGRFKNYQMFFEEAES